MAEEYDVIIIGGGVAGATSAHALVSQLVNPCKVLVLERGTVGRGDEVSEIAVENNGEQQYYKPWISGTAVFSEKPRAVKMIATLYSMTSKGFINYHGEEGAATYLRLTSIGREAQKKRAKALFKDYKAVLKEHGSILVGFKKDEENMKEEFQLLHRLGAEAEVEWLDKEATEKALGVDSGFTTGILFPKDAIIDSSTYTQALLKEAQRLSLGSLEVQDNCSPVVSVTENEEGATVTLESGASYRTKKVVVATGGFYFDKVLAGILQPCYSYLVAMPSCPPPMGKSGLAYPDSPNFFTYGYSHDWCNVDGVVRMSGEDHYSGHKLPEERERCKRLAEWTKARHPYLDTSLPYTYRYGIYSETPDALPIFGRPSENSNICYIVGCNAWGQALMSCLGDIVPAQLGLRPHSPEELKIANFCSVRRFQSSVTKPDTEGQVPLEQTSKL
eukprot:m.59559 g.59559  ORF g.59559 m.59559 type:complete len:445 (+) comp11255_c0_seq2:119-1453(+)